MSVHGQGVHFLSVVNLLRTGNIATINEIDPKTIEKESPIRAYKVCVEFLGMRMSSGKESVIKVFFSVSP